MIVLLILVIVAAAVVLVVGGALLLRRERPAGRSRVMVAGPPRELSLADRLAKTRRAMGSRLAALFGVGALDEAAWSRLEETLIAADVGVATVTEVVERVRETRPADGMEARAALRRELIELFAGKNRMLNRNGIPFVMTVVGVNGTGKTTSIAKLAHHLQSQGATTLLAAADTYRAGAARQLQTWAERCGADFVSGEEGADPASVAYSAYQASVSRGIDALIVDTAGRLHSNRNLMEELSKVVRVLEREADGVDEILLVLDATTGQNGIAQAKTFTDAVGVTGIVLTKLDGTARGGVVAAVERETGIPVKFIGVGEGLDDLLPFDPEAFIDALLE